MNKPRIFVGDFETTVYENQTETEVWASALVELYTDDVFILKSIEETYDILTTLDCNIILYYHNLKFDGAFWLDFLLRKLKYKHAYTQEDNNFRKTTWLKNSEMNNNTIKYLISETGQFYSLTIKHKGNYIEIRDSYKLLPFSVKDIGNSFETKHKKTSIEYKGFRYSGCEITPEEKQYIANDVLVIKEALEIMYQEGHNKLTIGSCCLSEFKSEYYEGAEETKFRTKFPNLKEYKIDKTIYGVDNADAYIRKSYKGGWCYINPRYQSKVIKNGYTLDVNSLYPSMMSGMSGNYYPIGEPHFWIGEEIKPDGKWVAKNVNPFIDKVYFFIRIKTKFRIKKDYLPFIQVKNSFMYARNSCLTTSNYIDKEGNEHEFMVKDGEVIPCYVTLTLTKTDYYLFLEHYDIEYLEILDGCWFYIENAQYIFDRYINKYKKIKMESKGGKRTLAKLYLNNLYGKLATADNSSFKIAFVDEETDSIKFMTVPEFNKDVVYIPIGSAITSYARNFTIRTAQKNYDKFIYADTDSIHCCGTLDEVKGVTLDDNEFCCWKHECDWDIGYFTRQKTYIEHVTNHGEPYYDIKCAGMPEKCKQLFIRSLTGDLAREDEELTDDERDFLSIKRELSDFDIGLKVPGKLKPKRITGGIILVDDIYTMRE